MKVLGQVIQVYEEKECKQNKRNVQREKDKGNEQVKEKKTKEIAKLEDKMKQCERERERKKKREGEGEAQEVVMKDNEAVNIMKSKATRVVG